MNDRASSQAATAHARGSIVGALIAFGWFYYGTAEFDPRWRYPLLVAGSVVTAVIVMAGVALHRRAGSMAPPTSGQTAAGRRVWRWFWLNFLGEVVLLNIAVSLLAAPELRVYWIAAISAVVGLHFLPMGRFFRVGYYYGVGVAMIAGAVVAALLIARHRELAPAIIHGEALANTLILWTALIAGALAARRR